VRDESTVHECTSIQQPTNVNPRGETMIIRVIAIATATLAISTCGAIAEKTGSYVYHDPPALPKINPSGSTGTTMHHELPMRAIINGHHVQPRRDLLDALGYSDLSPLAAEEVDRLNRQLLQQNILVDRRHS
jgi:hypothetical protein